jgi:cell fate regulator YaaT (PSP1 superfamily)
LRADCANGDFVITDGDRGIDIGQVISPAERPSMKELKNIKSVIRKATQQEVATVAEKEIRQREALQLCQTKARELSLPMEITGAEFQFDGKKLTFYYSATKYVDFRDLVRALFRFFGTRIWMVWHDGNAPVKDVFTRGAHH